MNSSRFDRSKYNTNSNTRVSPVVKVTLAFLVVVAIISLSVSITAAVIYGLWNYLIVGIEALGNPSALSWTGAFALAIVFTIFRSTISIKK